MYSYAVVWAKFVTMIGKKIAEKMYYCEKLCFNPKSFRALKKYLVHMSNSGYAVNK